MVPLDRASAEPRGPPGERRGLPSTPPKAGAGSKGRAELAHLAPPSPLSSLIDTPITLAAAMPTVFADTPRALIRGSCYRGPRRGRAPSLLQRFAHPSSGIPPIPVELGGARRLIPHLPPAPHSSPAPHLHHHR